MGSAAPASCFLPGLQALASPSDKLHTGSLSKSFLLRVFVVMVFIETKLREYSFMLWQHDPFKIFISVGLKMPSWHLVSPVTLPPWGRGYGCFLPGTHRPRILCVFLSPLLWPTSFSLSSSVGVLFSDQ